MEKACKNLIDKKFPKRGLQENKKKMIEKSF